MKKTISFFVATLATANVLLAQSVQDGIKFLNYEKNKSAKEVFQKLYDANSKDPQNIYWLGQTFIADDNLKAAEALYQKALTDGVNDPLIWVGSGHVQLLQGGDINSAKQKFEQAITATTETKGKNKGKPSAAILNAIGRANAIGHLNGVPGDNKFGDVNYGIEKLKQAETIDLVNADIPINEGISYRKLGGEYGGDAVKAFEEAIRRDAKNARANYLIGKIYLTQDNKEAIEKYFNAAIAADPTFPPVYFGFYTYYADKDVNKAKDYLDNFLKYADKDSKNDFFYADYLFRAGKYQESLAKAKEIEASVGIANVPALNILYAYDYDRLNDSVQAKNYIEKYFATVPASQTQLADYNLAVKVLSKFPGNEDATVSYIKKAIDVDTLTADRISLAQQAAKIYQGVKNYPQQLYWLKQVASYKKDLSSTDYFYLCDAAVKANDTTSANQLSAAYAQKYPDQIYGWRSQAMAAIATDYDSTKGTAIPAVEQYIAFLSKDSVKYQKQLCSQYYYLASVYSDKLKDYPKALETINRLLAINPTDSFGLSAKPVLEKAVAKPQQPKSSANKGNTTTSNGGGSQKS